MYLSVLHIHPIISLLHWLFDICTTRLTSVSKTSTERMFTSKIWKSAELLLHENLSLYISPSLPLHYHSAPKIKKIYVW